MEVGSKDTGGVGESRASAVAEAHLEKWELIIAGKECNWATGPSGGSACVLWHTSGLSEPLCCAPLLSVP